MSPKADKGEIRVRTLQTPNHTRSKEGNQMRASEEKRIGRAWPGLQASCARCGRPLSTSSFHTTEKTCVSHTRPLGDFHGCSFLPRPTPIPTRSCGVVAWIALCATRDHRVAGSWPSGWPPGCSSPPCGAPRPQYPVLPCPGSRAAGLAATANVVATSHKHLTDSTGTGQRS